ncbi:MAG: hypothetical protein ABIL09_12040, partial [Gemmatimonadota bacterium]
GRMVFHPLYPTVNGQPRDPADPSHPTHRLLLTPELVRAECRVRLLSFISRAPLDCPVAFVFGHQGLMNWAGAGYLDYGEDLSLDLWRRGYAVDLYPSTEIESGTLEVTADGWLQVGRQRYEVLVLYRPDLCPATVARFFGEKLITRTALVAIGSWERDDRGEALDGLGLLPAGFRRLASAEGALEVLLTELEQRGAGRQPPLVEPYLLFRNDQIGMPAPSGTARLVDGTVVRLAATMVSDGGDPIEETIDVGGVPVEVAAEGLFAARVDGEGRVEALAAGGLRRVRGGGLDLELSAPLDVALWRDAGGAWRGVAQGVPEVPDALKRLARDWVCLRVPPLCPVTPGA